MCNYCPSINQYPTSATASLPFATVPRHWAKTSASSSFAEESSLQNGAYAFRQGETQRHRLPKSVAHLLSIPPSAQLDTLASPTSTRKDKCHRGTAYSASIGACAVFVSQAVADTLKISTLDFMLDTHQMYGLNVYVPVLQAASHLVFPVVYLLQSADVEQTLLGRSSPA